MTDNYKNLISTPNASTYEKELENWEFIDTIDLIPYIEKYDDMYDLMEAVNNAYSEQAKDNSSMEGNVFNWITPDELAKYIYNKYNIKYYEKISIIYERD